MRYDFETMTDRGKAGSEKWASMYRIKQDVPEGIVPFSMADMEFCAAPEIVDAMKDYVDQYPLGYNCPTPGYLRSVCQWMENRHNWTMKEEWILPIPGVLVGIYAAIQALTQPGDGVIYCSPVFALFKIGIEGNQRKAVSSSIIQKDGEWHIDFEDLEKKASDPNNKVLLFCNPHNPLGRVWSEEELRRIGEICVQHRLLILSDEIHSDLIMPGYSHVSFGGLSSEIDERLIVGTAPTKTFNLAGVQVGNLLIPNAGLQAEVQKQLRYNGIFTVSAMGFVACETAYTCCGGWLDECIRYVYDNHLAVKQYVKEHMPEVIAHNLQATYLQWLDFRAICSDAETLYHKLCMEADVFMDPGDEFGPEGAGFVRMNLACRQDIILDALERIRKVVWE